LISAASLLLTNFGLAWRTSLVLPLSERSSRAWTKSRTSDSGTEEAFSSISSSRQSRRMMLFLLLSTKDLMVTKRRGRLFGAMYLSPRPLSRLSLMIGVSVKCHLDLISAGSEVVMQSPSIPWVIWSVKTS
jgi:hypothetical protein